MGDWTRSPSNPSPSSSGMDSQRPWSYRSLSTRKSPREPRFIWTQSWKESSPSPSLVEINGLHIGSCDYDADHLLNLADPILCPDPFPDGQACALPLMPGVYGGGAPLVIVPLDDIPDSILPFLKGVIYAEATLTSAAGDKLACIWVRAAVDHS